jgi:hypothetical protein
MNTRQAYNSWASQYDPKQQNTGLKIRVYQHYD